MSVQLDLLPKVWEQPPAAFNEPLATLPLVPSCALVANAHPVEFKLHARF